MPATPAAHTAAPAGPRVLAKPPVRKLAKDLGVDLASLAGTGPNGTVTREDVESESSSVELVETTTEQADHPESDHYLGMA